MNKMNKIIFFLSFLFSLVILLTLTFYFFPRNNNKDKDNNNSQETLIREKNKEEVKNKENNEKENEIKIKKNIINGEVIDEYATHQIIFLSLGFFIISFFYAIYERIKFFNDKEAKKIIKDFLRKDITPIFPEMICSYNILFLFFHFFYYIFHFRLKFKKNPFITMLKKCYKFYVSTLGRLFFFIIYNTIFAPLLAYLIYRLAVRFIFCFDFKKQIQILKNNFYIELTKIIGYSEENKEKEKIEEKKTRTTRKKTIKNKNKKKKII